jgi:hypothetical protein
LNNQVKHEIEIKRQENRRDSIRERMQKSIEDRQKAKESEMKLKEIAQQNL